MEPGAEIRAAAPAWRGWAQAVDLRLGADQRAAIRDVWRAFWLSRALVWVVGIATVLIAGSVAVENARLDSLWTTAPFDDRFANLIVAPAARFDSAWLLEIAQGGYDVAARAAFFPLYPALVAGLGALIGSTLVAGIALSLICSLTALYLLHRMVALDHGADVSRATVWIVCCFPVALCLSAVYTEGLFLLLSVGSLYAARLGRWPAATCCAALAASTRSAGILLVVPLLVTMLYGPRADRPLSRAAHTTAELRRDWRPRFRPGREAAWLALVPAGLLAYLFYLEIATGDALAAFAAQGSWSRVFAPLAGIAMGAWSALTGAWELLPGLGVPNGGNAPELAAIRDLVLFAFLTLAVWLTVQVAQRMAPGQLAYVAVSLALPLSVPAIDAPLLSLPRFMLVVFPFSVALALWSLERGVLRGVLVGSSSLLGVSSALFVAWAVAP